MIYSTKVKWKGNFDFLGLYLHIKQWLEQEGYGTPYEKLYTLRLKQGGKDVEIVWETSKKEGQKEYFLFSLGIEFYGTGLSDAQLNLEDGRVIAAEKGTIEIRLVMHLEQNAQETWNEGFIHELYEKYILRENIDLMKIQAYKDTMDLVEETKKYLQLYKL